MKHIKDERCFIMAVLTMILTIICFGMVIMQEFEMRFVLSSCILLIWSVVNFFKAFEDQE